MGNWMARVAVLALLGCIGCWGLAGYVAAFAAPGSWQVDTAPGLFLVGLVSLIVAVIAGLDVLFGGHRHRTGWHRCIHCGYDLRYTPDRCPECGTIPEKEPPPPTEF